MRAATGSAFLALVLAFAASAPVLSSEPQAVADKSSADNGAWGTPLSTDELGAQRGGDETVNSVIRVTGEVTDNVANHVITGANNIAGGSFANSSGISTVVQNTGVNVLIQTATIVNVQFTDP